MGYMPDHRSYHPPLGEKSSFLFTRLEAKKLGEFSEFLLLRRCTSNNSIRTLVLIQWCSESRTFFGSKVLECSGASCEMAR